MNTNEKLDLLDQKLERFSGNIKAILDKTTEDGQFAPTNKKLLTANIIQTAHFQRQNGTQKVNQS